MIELTSTQGSIELAISALLLVLGYRLARPSRAREWAGLAVYAASLAGQLLGAQGLLRGTVYSLPAGMRFLGAAVLLGGLVVAGAPLRARRRATRAGTPAAGEAGPHAQAGLALVLAGQLLRRPSTGGLIAVAVGIVVNVAVAFAAMRGSSR